MNTEPSGDQARAEQLDKGESESPSTPPPDDPRREAVHRLRNELFSVVLQAHRAKCNVQDGQMDDLEQRLTQIESSARGTQELLEYLLSIESCY